MRKIILFQNAIISGEVTIIALLTGFYELTGWKLVLVSVMGFVVFYWVLLQIERAYLRSAKNEKAGRAKDKGGSVRGKWWYSMRFSLLGKKNRNPGGVIKTIQEATRHNTAQPPVGYR